MGHIYAIFQESKTLTMCLFPEHYCLISLLRNGMKYQVSAYTDSLHMGKPGKSDTIRLVGFGDKRFPAAFFDIVEE